MRSSEWISVVTFALFGVAAAIFPLEGRKRWRAVGIGVAGILAATSLQRLEGPPAASALRDLAPGLFLLMVYWQSGQFFRGSDTDLQRSLGRIEGRWFPGVLRLSENLDTRPFLSTYLEAAYLMCYPIVPLAIGALYLAEQREAADQFWRVVLPPTYACYACTVFFQTLPPRLVESDGAPRRRSSPVRSLNLWVLRHASIRANTLPSGHVANSTAIALVLLDVAPLSGALFLWIAGSIAVATAVLRYHYSIDAVLGIGLAILSFVALG